MAKHTVAHIEIASTNPKVAGEFYSQLFGWPTFNVPGMEYLMFQPESGPAGAIVQTGQSYFNFRPETVIVYISTDDVAASLTKAESLGGKTVLPQTEIPGFGYFGIFQDPTGNHVGLYKSA